MREVCARKAAEDRVLHESRHSSQPREAEQSRQPPRCVLFAGDRRRCLLVKCIDGQSPATSAFVTASFHYLLVLDECQWMNSNWARAFILNGKQAHMLVKQVNPQTSCSQYEPTLRGQRPHSSLKRKDIASVKYRY